VLYDFFAKNYQEAKKIGFDTFINDMVDESSSSPSFTIFEQKILLKNK